MDVQNMTTLQVVEELNSMLFEHHEETCLCFTYLSNGDYEAINFADMNIWNSENDEREFIDEINDYEHLLPFLVIQFNKYIDKLTSLKL